jgi:hypothetical protein
MASTSAVRHAASSSAPPNFDLLHGSFASAVSALAPFGVDGAVFETAVLRLFVELGHASPTVGHHQVDLGFFSGEQGTLHFVDHPLIDQGFQTRLAAHGSSSVCSEAILAGFHAH